MFSPRIVFVVLTSVLLLVACGFPAALKPARETPGAYLIENAAVLDVDTGEIAVDRFIYVEDGIIRHVGHERPEAVAAGAARIDVSGAVVLPGLIDMHVHVFDEADLAANLAYGVTTIRNLGGMPFHLPMAQQIEQGRLLGPRLITTGTILNERDGRNTNDLQTLVAGADRARAAVRRQYRAGFRHLKVYSNLSRESLAAILDEAAQLGMTVSGHPVEGTEADPLEMADTLAGGFTTIEHAESIVWFGLSDNTDPAMARALAQQMAAANSRVTPTLIVHHNLARIVETDGAHVTRPDMHSFSPVMQGFEQGRYDYWASYPHDDRTRMQAFYVEMTGYMHEAGVELVVGTDAGVMVTPHGVSVSEEIELLVDAGLSPLEALQAATLNSAGALDMADRIGRVEAGYASDLLIVQGNPLEDFAVLRRPVGVMRGQRWLDAEDLAQLQVVSSNPAEFRTWRRVIGHVLTR
ncbi:amidohydrolase family protein [Maricaulis sp.]|uniref:amidohydrolase family protein n=1 Tax=Maricaulis sp. TaxID=1486257 RepID=UPI001B0D17DC|nr:amidohydrolase family protein [Maricaulis sp.]MBO6796613.1 amidohydrolase family protein [Maricaulis sp.]